MSDKDDEDGSDWLSSQFNPTQQVPAQPARPTQPVAPPPAAVAPPAAPPTTPYVPQQASAPATPATPAAPAAAAPAPTAAGGFNWGLRPGAPVDQAPATPAAPPVVPPLPVPPTPATPPVAPPVPPPLVPPTQQYAAPPTQYAQPPTEPYVPEPTQPLSWDEFASTQQAQQTAPAEQPTEAYTVQPWQPAAVSSPAAPVMTPQWDHPTEATSVYPTDPTSDQPADPTSAIDSLFGDQHFQDYEEVGVLGAIQVPPASTAPSEPELALPREPLPTTQKVLMGVAAGLIAALILVGLFFLGEHLGSAAPSTTASKGTNAPSATPTPAGTGGPAAPGVRQWSSLQGGECIQPFTSAWAVSFTVVSCTADHDAEMVFKGTLPDTSEAKYPTPSEFQKEITPLCSDSTAINYAVAGTITDLQISYSYPPNTASWLSGNRTYYCFVDRVSGGNLPGDLSVPRTP